MVVEYQQGYLSCGGPPGGASSHNFTPGFHSPGFQCQKEEFPQNLVVKIAEILTIQVRWKTAGNPDVPLRAHTQTQSFEVNCHRLWWKDSSLGDAGDIQKKIELRGLRARARETAAIVPVLTPPPVKPTGRFHFPCVKPSPHTTNLNLHWPSD